ncbi:LLM class flavin-dependent oxidoreductase [Rhodococcus sp. NPDC057014]|uniref:LLM class flavin-dependent oxidoreductase n=1 Tax=Rhodococcus sp. NPDC057014 TaxID=3346000 RepID=UPI0036281A37
MHVGLGLSFQSFEDELSDAQVWANAVRSSELAIELGFDGVWATEHHFTSYDITPDPLQFLTYIAALDPNIQVGTMASILTWHDPVRVAEQISVLDVLSGGRLILGIGRGLGKTEFEGLRIPMDESRERFIETTELVLDALETGVLKYDGKHFKQPERLLKPAPTGTFRNRTYAAAMSPDSFELMAELGVGLLLIAFKSWDETAKDLVRYREAFAKFNNGAEAPGPLVSVLVTCDDDSERAEKTAKKYMGNYYRSVIDHYGLNKPQNFSNVKGYEHYDATSKELGDEGDEGVDSAVTEFLETHVWGTPEDCRKKIEAIREKTGCGRLLVTFASGGVPMEEVERSMRLFASEVMPGLKTLDTSAVSVG